MRDSFGAFARVISDFTASAAATALAFIAVIVWAAFGPFYHYSDAWQLVINTSTTIITFLMVFVLNNAQARDTAAMNAKLDAIIAAVDAADDRLIGIEKQSNSALEELRAELETKLGDAGRVAR